MRHFPCASKHSFSWSLICLNTLLPCLGFVGPFLGSVDLGEYNLFGLSGADPPDLGRSPFFHVDLWNIRKKSEKRNIGN